MGSPTRTVAAQGISIGAGTRQLPMVGHSEVILGPNFPVVTWTYSGVLGHVPSVGVFAVFLRSGDPKMS